MNCPSAPRPTPTAREILEAAHAAERASVMQWGTASPGGLLAESHIGSVGRATEAGKCE